MHPQIILFVFALYFVAVYARELYYDLPWLICDDPLRHPKLKAWASRHPALRG